ncbi:baseplate J/gp47 family protein [Oceanospirillum sediminis]|uniref:Baseplate J/gp47 family protein n=1 Tax=Oceanospirillum sediminis TaxID=2760088 RepID=A0A839IVB1_9GAMM|nr:baseplate J/gp47 family protein [Oceanospirillum sediminis]MBB1489383.1 baseplate J/gp47 family protein [Oceanospirillum sediminis]
MLTDRNYLPDPEAIHRPKFEDLVQQFKTDYIANVRATDPVLADEIEKTLEQPGELLTKMCETFTQHLLNEIERRNQQAKQLLPGWSRGSNLDNMVAHQGIQRQVLDPGDPDAFPVIPPVQESDDHLLLRYLLQSHAPAAGSRMQYKASCLTLDESAVVTVTKPEFNKVQLTYTLNPEGIAAQIKDGNGLMPIPGHVTVTILAREGDGTASDSLLDKVREHFSRPDVAPGTDQITVQGAEIVPYTIKAVAWIGRGPDVQITEQSLITKLQAYADQQHLLEAKVLPSFITHILHDAGALEREVIEPAEEIRCLPHQAPYCTGIEVEVKVL